MVKIGIPSTLGFYSFYPMWKSFFEELGAEVLISPNTTKQIVDDGIALTVTDACLPIKLFHGHVKALIGKVDYIFLPRLVNWVDKWTFCPKFLGLPDMVLASIENLPPVIECRMDLRKGKMKLFQSFLEIGNVLKAGFWRTVRAFNKAMRALEEYENLLDRGISPLEIIRRLKGDRTRAESIESVESIKSINAIEDAARAKSAGDAAGEGKEDIGIALIGYPYVIYDTYANCGLLEALERLNVKVYTCEMVDYGCMMAQRSKLGKDLFWHYSNRAILSALHYMSQGKVDGVVHVTAFGCGPDAMVDKMIELDAKHEYGVPFLSIMIDEHSGDAGMQTRIEAFIDMIRRKKSDNSGERRVVS